MADRKIYTFNEITTNIETNIGSKSENLTDFTPGSNIKAIIDAFTHFVEFLQLQTNIGFEAFALRGARGDDLDLRVQDFGVTRKAAQQSTGIIQFKRNTPSPSDFTIYADGQLSTQSDVFGNTINYTIDSNIVFPSGSVSVTGWVTCTTAGIIGNVPSGYITSIVSSIPGVDTVVNNAAFTDGADEENDEQLRERVTLHINGLKAGNESAIRAAALSIPGVTVARVKENEPALGQITIFVSNQSGILTQEQIDAVNEAIDSAAAFGILVNLVTPTVNYITISMDVTYNKDFYETDAVVDERVRTAINSFVMNNTEISTKIVDLTLKAYEVPGVKNVKNVKINGVASDFTSNGFDVTRLADKYTSITLNWSTESD